MRYYVGRIHSDQGREYAGKFEALARERGLTVTLTRSSGDDPKQKGRAEVSAKAIKTLIRRVLLQGGVAQEWWLWAARHVNEKLHAARVEGHPKWPPFPQKVRVCGEEEPSKYLAPAPEDHGRWVAKEGQPPRVTRCVMLQSDAPRSERGWVAVEKEALDALSQKKKERSKPTVRMMKGEEGRSGEEGGKREARRKRIRKIKEEVMQKIPQDDPDVASEEIKIL